MHSSGSLPASIGGLFFVCPQLFWQVHIKREKAQKPSNLSQYSTQIPQFACKRKFYSKSIGLKEPNHTFAPRL